jgi:hypothetical protein
MFCPHRAISAIAPLTLTIALLPFLSHGSAVSDSSAALCSPSRLESFLADGAGPDLLPMSEGDPSVTEELIH